MGSIEDRISQCTFLQMTCTAKNPHSDDKAATGARLSPPRHNDPHDTSPAPTTTGWREDRCPVVSKLPLHSCDAAKMSPHISPEPVLADHEPSSSAADSHCQAREDSAPHCGTEFVIAEVIQNGSCCCQWVCIFVKQASTESTVSAMIVHHSHIN